MKKTLVITVSALVLLVSFANAQKNRVPSKSPKTELKIADKFYAESSFFTASEYYKDVVRQDSSNRYANYWLAMSLLMARDYVNSEVFFRNFFDLKPGEKTNKKKWDKEDQVLFNKADYYYGHVLHRNGKYDEAIQHLNKFAGSYKPKDETDKLKDFAKIEIEGCEYARNAPKAKVKVITAGPGVNHSYAEGAPAMMGENDLYYSTMRINGMTSGDSLIFITKGDTKTKRVYQIVHSTKQGNDWSKGKLVENADINDGKYNSGNGSFNAAGTRFYFTKCLEVDDDRPLCNIFVADFNNGNFSNVQRLPEPINEKEKYTSTQPTVRTSDDGQEIVYFVSDRPGGAGGFDIWWFRRTQNGEYKGPEVVKGPINTIGDEITPFFDDSTKTLYFSSNGHPGLGGMDVFRATENADLSWSEVTNIGAPVSSGADDLYYVRTWDQTNGFEVSNREGSVPLNGIKTASDDVFTWSNFRFAVQGIAFKEGNEGGGALAGATFKLYRKAPDGTKVLVGVDSMHHDGSYFFKLQPETDYVVEAERPGFQVKSEFVSTKGLPDEDTLNNNINVRKAMYVLKGQLLTEGAPTEKVKGASVTLVEVYPNGMEKTVYSATSDPYFYFDVDMGKKYKIVVRKNEYFASTTELNTSGLGQVDTIYKDISITKLQLNVNYTLQNVLYEFAKATLTENSKAVLDNLYQLLVENPAFIIELSSHTDGIGSEQGNLKLSQARAESCVNYLMSKGIAKDRMVAKGYGKSMPKVPNTKEDGTDDPAGRAINRRTEFKIIGLKKEQ